MYYELIDELPLFNWEQCVSGNINYTRLNPKGRGTLVKDARTWEKLYDQHLQRFGIGDEHQRIIDLKLELAELQCDYCIEGNAFLLNRIKILETDIKEILERAQNGMTIDECLLTLSRWLGYHLGKKAITCVEFHNYLKAYEKAAEEQKKKTKSA